MLMKNQDEIKYFRYKFDYVINMGNKMNCLAKFITSSD